MGAECEVGELEWSLREVLAVAREERKVVLSQSSAWRERIAASAAFLEREWEAAKTVYGVTTGYGNSSTVSVPGELIEELPTHLTRFHGCGLGRYLSEEQAPAVFPGSESNCLKR